MGRHKQHKPRRESVRVRPSTEWFGTAFHSVRGMQHLDVRQSGNGILITSSPAEIDGAPASWQLRLRNDDDGQGLNEMGTAMTAGRGHVYSVTEEPGAKTVLAFLPNHPDEGVGTLARVCTSEGPDGDVVFERSAERPMGLWAEAGENLLRIVPQLGPDAPPADGVDDCLPCPGCYRPVYESSSSHTLIGAGPMPVIGLCRLCADGSTLRSLRQADVPVDPQQRAVLETVAAAMA
ncbi:hypothetical protein [Streptomyces sp. NBC_01443]|uniref:hypothetical protein n=1 Tax=Streptomyces sp. NBC_01443 TaxID=2903868 RepID=UPI002253E2A0|nr:hypothetical protein [Streptomyces sp. NBC_01443]MCX4632854.1 hypothetical protein [Streptomyces sp. NBC_01443]MCX4633154.1 hypothetical protein [Streptomyces sp. NBC_01443]